jgi:outer membrane protein TolC
MKRSLPLLCVLFLCATTASAETLSLKDCLIRAESANYALKIDAFDEEIAVERVSQARSGYLPRLDLQTGYTVQNEAQAVKMAGIIAPTQDREFATFNAAVTQTLYDFGKTSSRLRKAVLLKEASASSFRGKRNDVALQVIETYFSILEAQKLLKASDEEVAQMQDHLMIAKNLFEQGVVTRNDVLQAEVRLAGSIQRKLSFANLVENRRLYLNYLTGRAQQARADLEEPSTDYFDLPADPTAETAKRPELEALRKAVQAGEMEVKEASTAFYPELYARMGADYLENSHVQEQTIYTATVGLKINLFDGFATTAQRNQAIKKQRQDEERLRQLEAQLLLELNIALNDARVAQQRITVTEKAIAQSDENLKINKDRYLEQVGTATDVLDAQTLHTQSKTEHFQAVYDYQVAIARVRKAMGTL